MSTKPKHRVSRKSGVHSARSLHAWPIFASTLGILLLLLWAIRHVVAIMLVGHHASTSQFTVIYFFSFIALVWGFACYSLERPIKVTPEEKRKLDRQNVAVVVPAYNEDEALLKRCLLSLLNQTRRPQTIFVVDDGSTTSEYPELKQWFLSEAVKFGIAGSWERKANGGKRTAQAFAFARTPEAEVYVTIDSDSVLDPKAVDEVLKPLAREDVHSVAGVVVAINAEKNVLTRFTDLWFVVGQLVDRSSMSLFGSVLVNSGALAAYRASVIRKNLGSYLNETFRGTPIEFSDDSMLTIYALVEGKAVQQPTAFAFTAMPENMSHHVRQYMRWMRGAFIRSFWRFRYLPVKRYAYWAHYMAWIQTILSWIISLILFVWMPFSTHHFIPTLLLIPILVGYGQSLRYFNVRRTDMSLRSQFLTYLLVPVAWLWGYFGLRLLRWYAIATCMRTGWGTRKTVEVSVAN